MGAELRIDDADAVRLAGELAELTGKPVGEAVLDLLREGVQRRQAVNARRERILGIAAAIRGDLVRPLPSSDHSFLYDQDGLPT